MILILREAQQPTLSAFVKLNYQYNMSEQGPRYSETEIREQHEITKRPEYAKACKNTKHSGDLVRELLKLGVPKKEVETFALARLEKYIRAGYGLSTLRSIIKQGGVVAEAELDRLFAEVKAEMLTETPAETEEEKTQREDMELEEMLKLYE